MGLAPTVIFMPMNPVKSFRMVPGVTPVMKLDGLTMMFTGAEVVLALELSVATAVSE